MSPAGAGASGTASASCVDGLPAQREVGGDVADDRAAQARARVVPADALAVRVLARVVAVAGQRGQVDPADERDLVVDDHDLLVVAVHLAPVGVQHALDPGAAHELVARGSLTSRAARLEHRHRRAGPDEHADGDALGGLGEQLAHRRAVARRSGWKPGSKFHEQMWTWRRAPRIASAIAGSAFAPSISTSRRCPRAAAWPVVAYSPSLAGASAASCPWRRNRRMWWRIIACSMPPPTAASTRSRSGRAMSLRVPASLTSKWPIPLSPSRSAWPPSASSCPCSRTIFDPAGLKERLRRWRRRWARRASGTTRRARPRWAPSTRASGAGWTHFTKLETDAADLEELAELAEEDPDVAAEFEATIASVETRLAALEEQRLFTGDYDAGDALVTVNAGAGGTDAQDWAEMVLRMEMRWAERRGFKVELLEVSAGEEAGIKSATFRASGENAYGLYSRREGRPPARAPVARSTPRTAARRPSRASRSRRSSRRPATSRSRTTTSRSTPTAPRARAASTSTRPTRRCASPTGRRGSSSSARTSARSRPTARPRWRCCAPS